MPARPGPAGGRPGRADKGTDSSGFTLARYSFRVTSETPETVPETPASKQADHIDEMLHRVVQFCDRWEPVLVRAEKFLHNPVGAYLKSPNRIKVPPRPDQAGSKS